MDQHTCSCACTVVDDKLISLCGLHAQSVRKNVDEHAQQKLNTIIESLRSAIGEPALLLVASRDELLRKLGNLLLALDVGQEDG